VFVLKKSSKNSSDILTLKKPERQPEHHEITSKLRFDCMNNEKPFCIFAYKKAKLADFECMHLK
jgi:hypothetical protein